MNKPKLIIMIGNIASGKTTWIKNFLEGVNKFATENNWVVLSKDDLRTMIGAGEYIYDEKLEPIIHTSLIDMLCNFMAQDVNIIIDATNIDKETRDVILDLTKKRVSQGYDYETIAVVMPKITREKAIQRRCGNKDSAWGNSAPTWQNVWQRKNDRFEIPVKEEGFDEILEVK